MKRITVLRTAPRTICLCWKGEAEERKRRVNFTQVFVEVLQDISVLIERGLWFGGY
jgi:hypothetical protein